MQVCTCIGIEFLKFRIVLVRPLAYWQIMICSTVVLVLMPGICLFKSNTQSKLMCSKAIFTIIINKWGGDGGSLIHDIDFRNI
jgi:hypothetical protein